MIKIHHVNDYKPDHMQLITIYDSDGNVHVGRATPLKDTNAKNLAFIDTAGQSFNVNIKKPSGLRGSHERAGYYIDGIAPGLKVQIKQIANIIGADQSSATLLNGTPEIGQLVSIYDVEDVLHVGYYLGIDRDGNQRTKRSSGVIVEDLNGKKIRVIVQVYFPAYYLMDTSAVPYSPRAGHYHLGVPDDVQINYKQVVSGEPELEVHPPRPLADTQPDYKQLIALYDYNGQIYYGYFLGYNMAASRSLGYILLTNEGSELTVPTRGPLGQDQHPRSGHYYPVSHDREGNYYVSSKKQFPSSCKLFLYESELVGY